MLTVPRRCLLIAVVENLIRDIAVQIKGVTKIHPRIRGILGRMPPDPPEIIILRGKRDTRGRIHPLFDQ